MLRLYPEIRLNITWSIILSHELILVGSTGDSVDFTNGSLIVGTIADDVTDDYKFVSNTVTYNTATLSRGAQVDLFFQVTID